MKHLGRKIDPKNIAIQEDIHNKADQSAFILSQSLPSFPVTDGLTLAFIPSLSAATVDFSDFSNPKVTEITDAGTGLKLTANAKNGLTAPNLKYSDTNGFWYLETDGVSQGLGLDDFPINSIVSDDGESGSIVCISTLHQQNQFNFGYKKKNSTNNYDHNRRYGVHFPWGNGRLYFDFGNVFGGRIEVEQPTGMSNDTDIRTVILRASSTTQEINVDNVSLVTGNPAQSFANALSETGYLGFAHEIVSNGTISSFSKMRCFAFLFYNRPLTDEEIGKINEWKNRKIGFTY